MRLGARIHAFAKETREDLPPVYSRLARRYQLRPPEAAGQASSNLTVPALFRPPYATVPPSWCSAGGAGACLNQAPHGVIVGDFNGDGRADFLSANTSFDAWLSNGNGSFVKFRHRVALPTGGLI